MSDRMGGFLGTAAVTGLAVLCCAGPFLVVAIAGLGLGAWLSAHGLWLLGGLVAYRRSRAARTCAVGERSTDGRP